MPAGRIKRSLHRRASSRTALWNTVPKITKMCIRFLKSILVISLRIQFTVKDLDFRIFWQFTGKLKFVFFMEIPKPAVWLTCRWRSNMQWWWDGLVSFYSPLSITAQDTAFFIKTHLSLTLNLDIWRNVFFCIFFYKI